MEAASDPLKGMSFMSDAKQYLVVVIGRQWRASGLPDTKQCLAVSRGV